MKVSIVVPVYNGAHYLKECLDSLLGQTLSDFEILVVDDCSTDSTPTVLLDYARRDPRVRVLTQRKNLGVSCARNRGIEAGAGRVRRLLRRGRLDRAADVRGALRRGEAQGRGHELLRGLQEP